MRWRGQRIAEPAGYTLWNRPCCAPSQEFCMISLPTGVWGGSDSRHNFAEWPNARAGGAPDGRERLGEHLPGAAA